MQSSQIFAQTQSQIPLNITISPVYYDFSANPGDTIKETIKLQNNTIAPMHLEIQIKKIVTNKNNDISIEDLTNQDQVSSWFHFKTMTINALPQEVTSIPFTLTIPKDAAFGYYMAIAFTQKAAKINASATVTATAAMPVLLNVRHAGAKIDANIVTFKTKNFINQYMPIDFITGIQNIGNIHIRPTGSIFIRNRQDKDLAIIDINKTNGDIIPGQIRTFDGSWNDGFIVNEPVMEDGEIKTDRFGKPVMHLVFHWDKLTSFRFGEYTASLLVVYDNGTRDVALEANTKFWIIPYTAIGCLVGGIIVLIFGIRFLLQLYVKQALKKYTKE